MHITRGMFCCFFDLTLKQTALALGVCLTTIKKIRIWSGVGNWPHADIRRGRHPQFTLRSVEAIRLGLTDSLRRQGDAVILPILVRAQDLALGLAVEPLVSPMGFAPPPSDEPVPLALEGVDLSISFMDLPCFEEGDGLLPLWDPVPDEGALRAEFD